MANVYCQVAILAALLLLDLEDEKLLMNVPCIMKETLHLVIGILIWDILGEPWALHQSLQFPGLFFFNL